MGTYSQPLIIKDKKGLNQMNASIAAFNASMDKEFKELDAKLLARQKQNQATLNKNTKAVSNKINAYDKKVTSSGARNIKDNGVQEGLDAMAKEYTRLANIQNPTSEEKANMQWLMGVPDLIVGSYEIGQSYEDQLAKALKNKQGEAGSIHLGNSDAAMFALTEDAINNDGANQKFYVDFENRSVGYSLYDEDEAEESFNSWKTKRMEDLEASNNTSGLALMQSLTDDKLKEVWEQEGDNYKGYKVDLTSFVELSTGKNVENWPFRFHADIQETVKPTMQRVKSVAKKIKNSKVNGLTIDYNDPKNQQTYNNNLATQLRQMDNGAIINDGSKAEGLWEGSVNRSINSLNILTDDLKSGAVDKKDLNAIDLQLLETWYGSDWEKEVLSGDPLEANDPIKQWEEEGPASFGTWRGNAGNPNDPMENWQREVMDWDINNTQYHQEAMITADGYIGTPKSTSGGTQQANKIRRIDRFASHYYDQNGLKSGYQPIDVVNQANKYVKNKKNGQYVTIEEMKNNKGYTSNAAIADYLNDLSTDYPNDAVIWLDRTVTSTDPDGLKAMFTVQGIDTWSAQQDKLASNIKYK